MDNSSWGKTFLILLLMDYFTLQGQLRPMECSHYFSVIKSVIASSFVNLNLDCHCTNHMDSDEISSSDGLIYHVFNFCLEGSMAERNPFDDLMYFSPSNLNLR